MIEVMRTSIAAMWLLFAAFIADNPDKAGRWFAEFQAAVFTAQMEAWDE